ncbi:MAG: peptidoglycan DD-metalloendopeptidase family protein, partial [Zoogloea sp.]|nr:peptidoglycan DD-metalloendopeptidase family protein [Zoogloea sp.]
MLSEKSGILSHLKTLRQKDERRFWAGVGSVAFLTFGMVTAVAVVPKTDSLSLPIEQVVQDLGHPELKTIAEGEAPFLREDRIRPGDTLSTVFRRLGISDDEALDFLRTHADAQRVLRDLRPGRPINATTLANGQLVSLSLPLSTTQDRALFIERHNGQLQVSEQAFKLETRTHMQAAEIRSSLFAATDDAGLPDSIAEGLADIFGNELDFNADLRKGDHFSVVYEVQYHQGVAVKAGRILSAEFVNRGKRYSAFLFSSNGKDEYYTAEGKSLKEGFMRSPLEFSRVTSGFAMRFHPILGIWREHKGVDYGAPIGTAVKATADGTVEFAGQQGGYGNFIVLRHFDRYTTAYGHLSRFAPRLAKGMHVSQGQVIGYVGCTGWATGPHLHYEFRVNNVHQDPLKVALPNSTPLAPAALAAFRAQIQPLEKQLELV